MNEPTPASGARLRVTPITLREANAYVAEHHRHHGETRGWQPGPEWNGGTYTGRDFPCFRCNRFLHGWMSPEWLRKAAVYVGRS